MSLERKVKRNKIRNQLAKKKYKDVKGRELEFSTIFKAINKYEKNKKGEN